MLLVIVIAKGGKHYLIFDKNRKFTRVQIFGKDIERFKARKIRD